MPNRLAAFDEGKYEDAPEVAASVSAWAERNLWLAVLERAWRDSIHHGHCAIDSDDRVPAFIRREARDWFRSDKVEPGSFVWILKLLGIEGWADKIRERGRIRWTRG